ncbi:DUF6171 family protein [Geobacillus sp. Y412MC52]|uniref:DUF6171 family protein n=1 Tax=Geobacillus sp. (strain Y412MC52) TaxID=550542 RepID=UPI0031B8617A
MKTKAAENMEEKNWCQDCAGSVIVTREMMDPLIEQIDRSAFVSDDVYEKRINICRSCSSLQYGTTCAYSGYLVHYQAKWRRECCPFPGRAKWGREE